MDFTTISQANKPARLRRRIATWVLPLALCSTSLAQQPLHAPSIPGVPPSLQRVDPLIGDTSPLGESLRAVNMQTELRLPTGFQQVYRVPGRDDLLMRASGGMYAIFPQSVYMPVEKGIAALIPPGTVFAIGLPGRNTIPSNLLRPPMLVTLNGMETGLPIPPTSTERLPVSHSAPVLNRPVSRRAAQVSPDEWTTDGAPRMNVGEQALTRQEQRNTRAKPPDPATFLKTVVTDDAYRSQRLAELLQQAAQASRAGG